MQAIQSVGNYETPHYWQAALKRERSAWMYRIRKAIEAHLKGMREDGDAIPELALFATTSKSRR
jgi:hypothetical protein